MNDDAWRLFAELCRIVCENDGLMLDVIISGGMIELMLLPYDEEEGEWEDEE